MCGRFSVAFTKDELLRVLQTLGLPLETDEDIPDEPAAVVTPGQHASILIGSTQGGALRRASWGFVLNQTGKLVINARSETAGQKSLFADAWRRRRCAIPASGFFETARTSPGKKKGRSCHFAARQKGELLFLGGLWSTDGITPRFVILTTEPNQTVAPIHDRMPLLIAHEGLCDWLQPRPLSSEASAQFIEPAETIILDESPELSSNHTGMLPLFP